MKREYDRSGGGEWRWLAMEEELCVCVWGVGGGGVEGCYQVLENVKVLKK